MLAAAFLIGITLLFVGIGHQWWGWMAKLQFLPSCLALNFAVIAGILLITILFGRIYCSVICPMGVFQDCVIWLRRRIGLRLNKTKVRKGQKSELKRYVKHFEYHKEHAVARYAVLAVFVVALILGIQVFIALIAPYSAYGRIVRGIVGLASAQSIAWPALLTAGVTLIAIFLCSWFWGREYCNTVCPVGTVLSLFGRFSLFKIHIDADKCKDCGRCGRGCKASCIDMNAHKVDYSRCIDCFDCIDRCKEGAIRYSLSCRKETESEPKEDKVDTGKRAFIAGAAVLGASSIARADGGLATVIEKQNPQRSGRLVPPGAESLENFYSRCTACGLCISACTNKVLRPSTDLEHFLQPQMGYEKGYCRPECTACSQVCPSGAILEIIPERKSVIKIGTAVINPELCLAYTGEATCGNCSRHCPTGAVRMVKKDGREVPAVNAEICIGCGACENLCPSRPVSAITVNGIATHQIND